MGSENGEEEREEVVRPLKGRSDTLPVFPPPQTTSTKVDKDDPLASLPVRSIFHVL
jgi:hypothetical protein